MVAQPLVLSAWLTLIVGVPPQLSVAVTCPATLVSLGSVDGLQPKFPPAGTVTIGGVVSAVHVAVRETVAELRQESVAVQVRVWERLQPVDTGLAVETFNVTGPQLSVAIAVPRAASICAAVGLQPNIPSDGVPVAVIIGGVESTTPTCLLQTIGPPVHVWHPMVTCKSNEPQEAPGLTCTELPVFPLGNVAPDVLLRIAQVNVGEVQRVESGLVAV